MNILIAEFQKNSGEIIRAEFNDQHKITCPEILILLPGFPRHYKKAGLYGRMIFSQSLREEFMNHGRKGQDTRRSLKDE